MFHYILALIFKAICTYRMECLSVSYGGTCSSALEGRNQRLDKLKLGRLEVVNLQIHKKCNISDKEMHTRNIAKFLVLMEDKDFLYTSRCPEKM